MKSFHKMKWYNFITELFLALACISTHAVQVAMCALYNAMSRQLAIYMHIYAN